MMPNILIGARFGKWTVIGQAGRDKWGSRLWLCQCDCGSSSRSVTQGCLLASKSTSCGCHKSVSPGDRFGRLVVISRAPRSTNPKEGKRWLCQCDCGSPTRIVRQISLTKGLTLGCGCVGREHRINNNTRHGLARSAEYSIWSNMLQRCENPNDKAFNRYGGRGITVFEGWKDFKNFITDMGPRPKGMSLERKDNNDGYNPDNCKWATRAEQARNKRSNRYVIFEGQEMVLHDAINLLRARAIQKPHGTEFCRGGRNDDSDPR